MRAARGRACFQGARNRLINPSIQGAGLITVERSYLLPLASSLSPAHCTRSGFTPMRALGERRITRAMQDGCTRFDGRDLSRENVPPAGVGSAPRFPPAPLSFRPSRPARGRGGSEGERASEGKGGGRGDEGEREREGGREKGRAGGQEKKGTVRKGRGREHGWEGEERGGEEGEGGREEREGEGEGEGEGERERAREREKGRGMERERRETERARAGEREKSRGMEREREKGKVGRGEGEGEGKSWWWWWWGLSSRNNAREAAGFSRPEPLNLAAGRGYPVARVTTTHRRTQPQPPTPSQPVAALNQQASAYQRRW